MIDLDKLGDSRDDKRTRGAAMYHFFVTANTLIMQVRYEMVSYTFEFCLRRSCDKAKFSVLRSNNSRGKG